MGVGKCVYAYVVHDVYVYLGRRFVSKYLNFFVFWKSRDVMC